MSLRPADRRRHSCTSQCETLHTLVLSNCPALALRNWDPSPLSPIKTKLKSNSRGGREDQRVGEGETCNFQGAQDKVVFLMQIPRTFVFTYKRKNAVIINPNKDTPLAATFSKRFGRAGIYKPTADRLQPDKRPPAGFPNCDPSHPKKTKGVMIHDQQHAKGKQEKWYKIEIITIHVQHAGLIFLMQIFVFFLYNQAGNKIDEICAQNVPN